MNKVRFCLQLLYLLVLGPGFVLYNLYQGNAIQATLWSLPLLAIILAIIFPGAGPGHFAVTYQFGPVRQEGETERQYHLKMAKCWFLGSLTIPLGVFSVYLFESVNSFVVFGIFAGFLFGVPCFLKGLASLFQAARSKNSDWQA